MVDSILLGNAIDVLKTLPANSVDCVVTSPPYYGLRDYGPETQAIWGVKVADTYFDGQLSPNITPRYWCRKDIVAFRKLCRKHNQLVNFEIDPELRKTIEEKCLLQFERRDK